MEKYDLGLAFVCEYDLEFINLIEFSLQQEGISTFRVTTENISEVTERFTKKEISFNFYLDRASDVDDDFEELAGMLSRRHCIIFNPYNKISHAIDKANMHLEFITAGLNVPYSIIIPPHSEKEELYISMDDLAILGRPFIIKPCNTTGGGIGVVTGAESLKEIMEERIANHKDKYILQQKIYPKMLDGKRAWFRSFWAFGKAIPAWWDDQIHIYNEISDDEIKFFGLKKLFSITKTIANLTGLDFFSTEIVLTPQNLPVVIDYVNDQCDMRFNSKHPDGVPDNVVKEIIDNLIKKIKYLKKNKIQSKRISK